MLFLLYIPNEVGNLLGKKRSIYLMKTLRSVN